MRFDSHKQQSHHDRESLTAVQRDLSSLWMGSDNNVESTFVNGANGKLEQLWVSALSERGRERFVYCNQASRGDGDFKIIPPDVAEQVSHLYGPIVQRTRGLTDSMPDLFRVMEPSMWLEFWTQGVGEDMFELPAGLKTRRPVALMPCFESFCDDPTLGRNLFAVGAERFNVGVFIHERDNFSLIAFNNSLFKIPGGAVAAGGLREFTFAHARLLVEGSFEEFYRGVGQFKEVKTWEQAGGPSVMLATKLDEGAALSSFRIRADL